MRRSQKPCAEFGCGNLTRKTYCKTHEKNIGETARNYNKYVRDPVIDSFYKSKEWQRARAVALEVTNGLCKRCRDQGYLVSADVVHHQVEVKDDWSQRLNLKILEPLCHSCHNLEHKTGPRGRKF